MQSTLHCGIKESLLIKDLKPSLNENVGSKKLFFTSLLYILQQTLIGLFFIRFFTIVLIRFQSFALAFKSCCILSNRHF